MFHIGVTDLQYFSSCRRKWWLEKGWEPWKPNVNYWFGTAMHHGLETLYNTGDETQAYGELQKFMEDDLKKLSAELPEVWDNVATEFEDLYGLCLGVFSNYLIYDREEPLLREFGEKQKVESKIKVPLFDDDKLGTISLVGKIDLVLQRPNGDYWIIDHKTSGSLPDFAGLDVDEQLTGYSYLLHRKTGIMPMGVIYNILIKDLPNSPKVLKDGSLSKDIAQKTTYSLYTSTMTEMGVPLDDPDYEKVLSVLKANKWNRYFTRGGSTRNDLELQSFWFHTLRKARDIVGIMKDPTKNAYPSASTYNCSYCPFLGVCKSMEDGGDWQAVLNSRFVPKKGHE